MTKALPCALGGPRHLLLKVCGWGYQHSSTPCVSQLPLLLGVLRGPRARAGLATQGRPQGHGLQTRPGQGLHGGVGGGRAS